MTEDYRVIAAKGVADGLKRSPVIFGSILGLVIEGIAILAIAWTILEDHSTDRDQLMDLNQKLTEQVIACWQSVQEKDAAIRDAQSYTSESAYAINIPVITPPVNK